MPLKGTGRTGLAEAAGLSRDITAMPDHRGLMAALHQEVVPTEGEAAVLQEAVADTEHLHHVVLPIRGREPLQAEAQDTEVQAEPAVREVPDTEVREGVCQEVQVTEVRVAALEAPVVLEVRADHSGLQVEADQAAADVQVVDAAGNKSRNRLNKTS